MAKKRNKDNYMLFCGNNSLDVTGSMIYIQFEGKQILLENGMVQNNDYLLNYKANSEKYKFNPEELDYVFVGHTHVDHIGMIPRLVKEGFHGKIICSHETALLMKPLLLNSAFILRSEASTLSFRYKRDYAPLYDEEDVFKALECVVEYDGYGEKHVLDDVVSFEFLKNSHCLGARQTVIYLTDSLGVTQSVLYTSDVGALDSKNHYVENTEIDERFHKYVIMESTYGDGSRNSKKTREFDVEHLRVAIETVTERGGSVIMPCFSFARTQELLTILYELYKDTDFPYDVVVDSMLSCDICSLYNELLNGEDLELWKQVCSWKNVKLIKDKESSIACVKSHAPKIVLSSSGFCQNGRILSYLHEYLSDENSMVIFSGYTGSDNSYLSFRIKNYKENKVITVSGDKVKNNADCISLQTFSSHASQKDLIEIGSKCNCEKLILVHGSPEAKNCLKHELQEAISKEDKTFKVVASNKDMVMYF